MVDAERTNENGYEPEVFYYEDGHDVRSLTIHFEKLWGTRPYVQLACSEYADEHWQFYKELFMDVCPWAVLLKKSQE